MLRIIGILALLFGITIGSETWPQGSEAVGQITVINWSLNCAKPGDATEAAACEQKRATDLAERAYILSWWQAAIGLAGLLLVLASLWVAWRSASAAMKSAEAALEGVKIQQRIGQATVRAYLTPLPGDFEVGQHAFHANVKFENAGQSPAKTVRVSWALRVRRKWNGGPMVGLETETSFAIERRFGTGYVSPKECRTITLHATNNDLGQDLASLLENADFYVALECRLHWKDVFESSHFVTFELAEFPTAITGLEGVGGKRTGGLHIRQAPAVSLLGPPKRPETGQDKHLP